MDTRAQRPYRLRLLLLLPLLLSIGGCGLIQEPFDGKHRLGTLIQSWSQGEFREIETIAPEGTLVLADDADRDAFLSRVPSQELGIDRVRDADLSTHFLVLGAYTKCKEQSRVWMDDEQTAVWFEEFIAPEDRNTVCAWSPLTIDVWQLSREDLGEVPAEQLKTREPN